MGMIDNPKDSRQGWADFKRRVADLERVGPASPSGGGPAVETTYTVATHDAADGIVSFPDFGLKGMALDVAADTTVVGAEFFCSPWGTGDSVLECWTVSGAEGQPQTLGAKVGDSSTLTFVGESGSAEDSWVAFPRFSWPLTAGTRYAILLYEGFDTAGPKMTSDPGVLWTEPLVIAGLGTVPATLGYMKDPSGDNTPERAVPGKQLTPTPKLDSPGGVETELRVLFQMRLITATGGGGPAVTPAQISTEGASDGQVLKIVGGVPTWVTP